MRSVNNFYYCEGLRTTSGDRVFRVGARSASGNSFRYDSSSGMENLGNTHMGTTRMCEGISSISLSYGFTNEGAGAWFDWVEG